jgi:hypothetical protein
MDHQRRGRDDHQRDRGVDPVVVGCGDDREQRDRRVHEGEQAASSAANGDERAGHHDGPAEVQRRHRRELIGDRLRGVGAVDAWPVALQGVDETRALQHSWWCQRIQHVHDQRCHRDADEPGADAAVVALMSHVHPHQERCRQREVNSDVVAVQEAHDQVAVHDEPLHSSFTEDVETPFQLDNPIGVGHRRVGVVA